MKKLGNGLLIVGGILILASLALWSYNMWDENRAARTSEEAVELIDEAIARHTAKSSSSDMTEVESENPSTPSEDESEETQQGTDTSQSVESTLTETYKTVPEVEMPTVEIEEDEYIGKLEIPSLGLSLPVMSDWSYPKLKKAPCRYAGSAYMGNLIIAAHNYTRHFGKLKYLSEGDVVTFTDMDGNVFNYQVAEIEQLEPTAIEYMEAGDWDLTLFTCTVGGSYRVTVRCVATD
jgi:sortase A